MKKTNLRFIRMRNKLIKLSAEVMPIWDDLQGQEFADEHGWLKGKEEEEYRENRNLWDTNMPLIRDLIVKIKEEFPEEVKAFAEEQYTIFSELIKTKLPEDHPLYDEDLRGVRQNWSALAKGKKTPFNEFWAWGMALLK